MGWLSTSLVQRGLVALTGGFLDLPRFRAVLGALDLESGSPRDGTLVLFESSLTIAGATVSDQFLALVQLVFARGTRDF
jgi:hypothetical protein